MYCKITLQFHFGFVGLTLEFNIQQSEYISALAPDAGIRVSIHERGTYPFPEDDGFTVAPGSATSVALKQAVILARNCPLDVISHQSVWLRDFFQLCGSSPNRTLLEGAWMQLLCQGFIQGTLSPYLYGCLVVRGMFGTP